MARDIKKIDAKGRFFLPSKFKEKFDGDLVVTVSLDKGYLCVYTAETFEKIEEQFAEMNSSEPEFRIMERWILGEALDVKVDAQGRISLTSELWERIDAHPGDEICVRSMRNKLEICTKKFFDSQEVDFDALNRLGGKYYVKLL